MPNWCSNRVTFSSENCHAIDFIRDAFDSPNPFHVLRPEPDWRLTPNEQGVLPGPCYGKWGVSRFPDGSTDNRWHGWRNANWGVKWDIGSGVDCSYDDKDMLKYEFLTPWGPPTELCFYLREKFTDLDITWFYDEPGSQFAGYL